MLGFGVILRACHLSRQGKVWAVPLSMKARLNGPASGLALGVIESNRLSAALADADRQVSQYFGGG
jgi:hypothetical protein